MGKTQAEFPGRSKLWLGKHSWDKDSRLEKKRLFQCAELGRQRRPSDAARSLLPDT
jgi:hypothetical protein